VKAYGALADRLSTQISKGYMVLVEGRLAQDRWTSSEGKSLSRVNIVADSVKVVAKAGAKTAEESPKDASNLYEEDVNGIDDIKADIEKSLEDDDDVPF
jgi:single-strand DNA-binding protein